jgi:UDP-glucose 4-epimerase
VRDVVGVLPRMLGAPACYGRIFNVGSDRALTIEALAELVIATLGSRSGTKRLPYAEAFGPGFEDLKQRQPDLARLRGVVGFEPRTPLERTIKDIAAALSPGRPA